MSTLLADPAKMIAKGAPHVIHNDEELEAYTNALFQLTALEKPSRSEVEAIELLILLVERYEETHYPIPAADAVSVVRFLLEQQELTQRDLIPEFRIGERRIDVSGQATETHPEAGAEIKRSVQPSCGCLHLKPVSGIALMRKPCQRFSSRN
jgi:HTH-type transcriptional regulator/antitoxin HigA